MTMASSHQTRSATTKTPTAPRRVSASAIARRAPELSTSPGGRTAAQARRCRRWAPWAYSLALAAAPEISVVIPCLDEEQAVGAVVDQAWEGIERSGRTGEVIVVDNGSSDHSAEIAADHGATVVFEGRRGYGRAYLTGLAHVRGQYVVMADADGTYPLAQLAPFVDALEAGNDLVLGSRFAGKIHEGAMPWSNRWIGNPVLTGMLNSLFGVKVSDAHCGMRALRRSALPVLDLHSTGMEFASEMVFKAFRTNLHVSEVPIDYFPRTGDSKLSRFGDGWRHVRFMLLYSPSWLYFVPSGLMLLLGLAGMLVLASGPVDVLGRTWQIHTMLAFVALTLVGAQILQLGLFARTYALTHFGVHDELLERLRHRIRLEHGLLLGLFLVLVGLGILLAVFGRWAAHGFGALAGEYPTALGVTLLGLGVQTVFGSFFIGLLTMRAPRDEEVAGVSRRVPSAVP
ncbi:MAG: glycosyltransferase family 2 protein [Candidatus Rokuibacteriota bacterium]|nr:MAG: glycosyltransferase family 2 protein [Candidatus Rokubacteria bacterium]